MQVEIITIGDEILIGQTIDTNSAWMGAALNEVGADVYSVKSVRDTPEAIVEALGQIHARTSVVLLTGGLGPTKDDLTKHTLNAYFGGTLEYHPEIYQHIEQLFESLGRVPNELNRDQANVPNVCTPLFNKYGTAPGMRFEKDGVYYISMPGVPFEMKGLMKNEVIPWITENFIDQPIVHRTLLTHGLPESELAGILEDWENNLPAPLKLAYLPSPGMVKLRLTAREGDQMENDRKMSEQFNMAKEILGDSVYGEDAQSLEEVVGELLKDIDATVSTAESCTGGAIASRITRIPGSSAYFCGGIVSYANQVKVQQLGVKEADLLLHGAVSDVVVRQMAKGAQKKLKTTYAIAVSGIAGPDGGTEEKPVGTVWMAVAGPKGVNSQVFHFGKSRERNIERSVLMGLDLLRRQILSDMRAIL